MIRGIVIRVLNRVPLVKRALRAVRFRLFPGSSVSSNYVSLAEGRGNTEGQRLRNSWQDEALPARQRELVEQQLQEYRSGKHIAVFDIFQRALRELPGLRPGMSLLEIGCSSGYYSEVIAIAKLPLQYTGCDYSAPFIKMALEKYPTVDFTVADATDLPFHDQSFDIVISGCCLLHIPEYVSAIEETARVCRQFAIFHRTPVVWGKPNQWFRKQAYGVETVEIHFNETEFLGLLRASGLELMTSYTLHEGSGGIDNGHGHSVRTYVCRKQVL
jgi:SAM-dependent methyltransferase